MEATNGGTLMTVDYESLAASEELQQLVDGAEVTGAIRYPELTELLEALQFDPLEVDAVYRELEQRGIEVIEETQQAKQRMIQSNLRLVVSIAKNYRNQGLPFLDLIQE